MATPFIYILSLATFMPLWWSWRDATEAPMAHKAENIYYLASIRKHLPTSDLHNQFVRVVSQYNFQNLMNRNKQSLSKILIKKKNQHWTW